MYLDPEEEGGRVGVHPMLCEELGWDAASGLGAEDLLAGDAHVREGHGRLWKAMGGYGRLWKAEEECLQTCHQRVPRARVSKSRKRGTRGI